MTESISKSKPKADAKQKLLKAAMRLVTTHKTLTSRSLAAKAGVNHAMINYHFGSLSNLYGLIVKSCISELQQMLLPELKNITEAANQSDAKAARQALAALLKILSGPQGAKLLSALTQPHPNTGFSIYSAVMLAVLKPMHKAFGSLIASFRGVEYGSLECSVLGQLMISDCMAFFRGGGVVLSELEQQEFTPAQTGQINNIILESLCDKAGLSHKVGLSQ